MSSKQQRAAKGKAHKVSRNDGWTALSWDDLAEWAGSRSVDRGRTYQKQGRVHDLAISEDGWLLATVTGGARYAVTVWYESSAKKAGAIYSRCTCPVGSSGCKHAVAVVAEYLERLSASEDTPVANQDDDRWELLADETGDESEDEADDLDMDTGDDEGELVGLVDHLRCCSAGLPCGEAHGGRFGAVQRSGDELTDPATIRKIRALAFAQVYDPDLLVHAVGGH